MRLRTAPQANKLTNLPAGISCTWRKRPGTLKRPYFEFQVRWVDDGGRVKVNYFYVGVEPTHIRLRLAYLRAMAFRRAYELRSVA